MTLSPQVPRKDDAVPVAEMFRSQAFEGLYSDHRVVNGMGNECRRPVDMRKSELQAGQGALFWRGIVQASERTCISLPLDLTVVTSKDHQRI